MNETQIIELFKNDPKVEQILFSNDNAIMRIENLIVETSSNIAIHILAITDKIEVESSICYFYERLEPMCNHLDIDFGSLLCALVISDYIMLDLITFEDLI